MLKVENERNADGEFQPLSSLSHCLCVMLHSSGLDLALKLFHRGFTQSMWQDDPFCQFRPACQG